MLFLASSLGLLSQAALAELKVDINNTGRPLTEGQDPAFAPWSSNQNWFTSGSNSISATFGNIGVTFTRTGSGGTALSPGYWKAGVQSTSYDVRLTGDGIKVDNGDSGSQIEMRISGLSSGTHTVLLYHNSWDNLSTSALAPVDVLVNGTLLVNNSPQSVRTTNNSTAGTSYVTFSATSGQDVVILIRAETGGSYSVRNLYLNGFEIDTPNAKAQANTPNPPNADEHVNADNGSYTLTWSPAIQGAASHNVYFGTSRSAVENATTGSSQFLGNQTSTSRSVSNLSSAQTYYWRVDEVSSGGAVTKGGVWYFRPRRLAFPGAEGYGRFAQGGRGGVVVEVTNLNDSGAGSLRAAVENDVGPRTIVFTVGGLITLNSPLTVNQPYITLAGQTAPGKGICVRGYSMGWSGAVDNIIRHMRFRPGDISGTTLNGTGMAGVDHTIMDHCSVSWGLDEGISTRNGKNLTLQRTLISEALNIAGHSNYPAGTAHGYAASIGGDVASFHHNLLAHNSGRNWSLAGGLDGAGYYAGKIDIFNNVVYNWDNRTTDGGAHQVNFVNNYYKPGAATSYFYALNAQYDSFPGTQQYYFAGNVMPGRFGLSNQSAGRTRSGDVPSSYSTWVNQPFFPSYATIHSAEDAYKLVLSDVGANQPVLDAHDQRVIQETYNGSYTYTGQGPYGGEPGLPNSQNDVGGWENYPTTYRASGFDSDRDGLPNWWEEMKGLNPNSSQGNFADANVDLVGDQFTELERYLNWMAEPHVMTDENVYVDVPMTPLAAGFPSNASFSVNGAQGGSVSIVSGNVARFTPTNGFSGLGKFNVVVSQGGTTMTRTIGVAVIDDPNTGGGSNNPPTVSITSPANNATITAGSNVTVSANAADSDGTISGVAFYRGQTLLGSDTSPPYSVSWNNVTAGNYVLAAIAVDDDNAQTTSSPVYVTVTGNSGNSTTLQAESASVGGGTTIDSNNAGFNGSGFANAPVSGGYVQFNNVNGGSGGTATLEIRYALGATSSRTGALIVNGSSQNITFNPTGSWTAWTTMSLTVPLQSGTSNTIRFESNGQDLGNLDEITVTPASSGGGTTTLQIESGSIGGGTAIESNNGGFNGSGFANFPSSGGYAQLSGISGSSGAATLEIRYALGASGSRTGALVVNGSSQSITFDTTGAWNVWVIKTVNISLQNGSNNTIRFESNGQDLGNLDEITVSQ